MWWRVKMSTALPSLHVLSLALRSEMNVVCRRSSVLSRFWPHNFVRRSARALQRQTDICSSAVVVVVVVAAITIVVVVRIDSCFWNGSRRRAARTLASIDRPLLQASLDADDVATAPATAAAGASATPAAAAAVGRGAIVVVDRGPSSVAVTSATDVVPGTPQPSASLDPSAVASATAVASAARSTSPFLRVASPPSKRRKTMQDQQLQLDMSSCCLNGAVPGPHSAPFSSSSAPSASCSVASRLKRLAHAHTAVGARSENGSASFAAAAAAAVSPDTESPITAVELSAADREMVRLILQHLKNIGMHDTVKVLMNESGCRMELPIATRFREDVLSGQWDAVLKDVYSLQPYLEKPQHLIEMKFMILEQKYLELVRSGQLLEALMVLREEITPLRYNMDHVHRLSSYLMFSSSSELRQYFGCDTFDGKSRERLMQKLQGYLPASVILPPRRLETLVSQALQWQRYKCILHNVKEEPASLSLEMSLLSDHSCSRATLPCHTSCVLTDHCDEVWFCKFSHNGRYLATGSKESTVYIWEVDTCAKSLQRKFAFDGHAYGASYFSWSPDDRYLAVVGPEDGPDLWIWNVEKGDLRIKVSHSPEDSIGCVSWHVDGQKFVCGGTKGQFYHCDLDGNILESWEGIRVRMIHCKRDGRTVLAADTHHRIRNYCFDDLTDQTLFKEDHSLMYFSLDQNQRYALCNIASQGVHMWDIDNKSLVRRFRGSTQGYYTIFSCFGGVGERFVASGSEDGNVYIWHRDREEPLLVLKGHNGVVNAVSWNPVDPSMLVSCSDDGTVRLWSPFENIDDSGEW